MKRKTWWVDASYSRWSKTLFSSRNFPTKCKKAKYSDKRVTTAVSSCVPNKWERDVLPIAPAQNITFTLSKPVLRLEGDGLPLRGAAPGQW